MKGMAGGRGVARGEAVDWLRFFWCWGERCRLEVAQERVVGAGPLRLGQDVRLSTRPGEEIGKCCQHHGKVWRTRQP